MKNKKQVIFILLLMISLTTFAQETSSIEQKSFLGEWELTMPKVGYEVIGTKDTTKNIIKFFRDDIYNTEGVDGSQKGKWKLDVPQKTLSLTESVDEEVLTLQIISVTKVSLSLKVESTNGAVVLNFRRIN